MSKFTARAASSTPVRAANGKYLDHGAYISKEIPKVVEGDDFDEDEYEEENGPFKAWLASYDTRGDAITFVWKKEVPKKLFALEGYSALMKKAPEIFAKAPGAKLSSDGSQETGWMYKFSGGALTIAIDND